MTRDPAIHWTQQIFTGPPPTQITPPSPARAYEQILAKGAAEARIAQEVAQKLAAMRALRVQEAEEADRELETVLQELAAAKRSLTFSFKFSVYLCHTSRVWGYMCM
jgi:hypothetical protein